MELDPEDERLFQSLKQEPPRERRLALNLIRIVAAGFFIVGSLDLLAYWFKCHKEKIDLNVWHCLVHSIPLVIGVAILIKSSALAARVEEYLDE
jgi:hypothetical protein